MYYLTDVSKEVHVGKTILNYHLYYFFLQTYYVLNYHTAFDYIIYLVHTHSSVS